MKTQTKWRGIWPCMVQLISNQFDIGLSPVGDQFDAVYEEDLEAGVSNGDVEVLEVEDADAMK